ncbi:hypothetical protein NKH77_10795 [Streptomyces sp. M19]
MTTAPTGPRRLGRTDVRVPPSASAAPNWATSAPRCPRTRARDRRVRPRRRVHCSTPPALRRGAVRERLGRALAGATAPRSRCPRRWGGGCGPRAGRGRPAAGLPRHPDRVRTWDLSGDGIRATLESSLERLGLDAVDIVYLHDVEDHLPEVYESAFPPSPNCGRSGSCAPSASA